MDLAQWLEKITTLHPQFIDLGLERVNQVKERLAISPACPLIIVGGTNGKGSCVAALEAIYIAAGYKVGTFTSPFLFRYNEEIKIQGVEATDAELCQAFEQIEQARGEMTLTYFEWSCLASFLIFQQAQRDVWILEVGLGGRLDAVNCMDADIAIVTTVALDHMDRLGHTREEIGWEKAGIFRAGKVAICGDFSPPLSLIHHAKTIQAKLYCQGKDFHYKEENTDWHWSSQTKKITHLPFNSLALQNLSTALMAVELLQDKLPIENNKIKQGLKKINLIGRIQVIHQDQITHVFDVSHNPAAVKRLAEWLTKHFPPTIKIKAVFSMLKDKDILSTISVIKNQIHHWYVAPLTNERAASLEQLNNEFVKANINALSCYASIEAAYQYALQEAQPHEAVVVFGSFYTVAVCLRRITAKSA